ncbi:MBL fold metallo-hydrolase [Amycolatopsis sp. cmx-4-68]|uniref:MBL fold metallo-hydrolase n=1 Tax=Amycolatopsis sp. cmx-4-68 TaxID=2790938 RepID=UPI00397B538A
MPQTAPRHRIRIGATTVTYLPDGAVHADPEVIFPATAARDWTSHRQLLDTNGWLTATVGSFLVRTDSSAALVDLGLGRVNFAVPGVATYQGGRLLASLHAEGLSATDIDLVLFTHLHRDHVGWTSDGMGGLTFPNAWHLVDRAEWDHWQSHTDATGPDLETVLTPLSPIVEFFDARPPEPGLQTIPTPGHTPGHTSVLITDPASETRLLILGDAMHTTAQLTEPHWHFRSDADPALATTHRRVYPVIGVSGVVDQ